jgi:hypothetical protein
VSKAPQPTTGEIKALLAARHAKDTWVPECNTGSSWRGCRRLDGWALVSTWSPVTTIGYEIKDARSDFLRDDKWPAYLPYCHLFYFVCPRGVIAKEEVPEGCGLIYAGARLLTTIKAPRHEPQARALNDLMTYVLMSRVSIKANMYEQAADSGADYWRGWLERRDDHELLGRSVSAELQRRVAAAEDEARGARRERQAVDNLVQELEARGLSLNDGRERWNARRAVDRLLREESGDRVVDSLRSSHEALGRLITSVEDLRRAGE